MNCSKARRLPALLGAVLRELCRAGNSRAAPPGPGPGADGSLYILLSMIFYSCLGGALTWRTPARGSWSPSTTTTTRTSSGTRAPSARHSRRRAAPPRGSARESSWTGGQSSAT
uniref:Caspase family p10 domain-containing protein n=1 Tax=Ficedula albicollis TaxID=59894 RepID=A0A803V675_FICAL